MIRTRTRVPARCIRAAWLPLLAAVAASAVAPAPAGGQPAATSPATPEGILGVEPLYEPPAVLPAEPAGSVDAALDWTGEERELLSAVADGEHLLEPPAVYVLLRRAAMLPPGLEPLERADAVPMANLLRRPRDYRGRLVRMDLELYDIERWDAARVTEPWWGRRPVWRARAHDPRSRRSVILLLAEKPDRFPVDAPVGQAPVRVAGLFCGTLVQETDAAADPAQPRREYPVLVIDRFYPPADASARSLPARQIALVVLVAGMLVVFYFLRRSVARRRKPAAVRPRPAEAAEPPPDEPVDPDLVHQMQDYQARHKDANP